MSNKLKRGYENGFKSIEIQDGKVDLILHNEKETTFYFYRFNPEQIFGQAIDKQINLVNEKQVSDFIKQFNREYKGLINELIQIAIENNMKQEYDV